MAKTNESIFDDAVYLAILHIKDENYFRMPAYSQIICRFINGNKNSSFYDIFQKYPDVCGSYPQASMEDVEQSLTRLKRKKLICVEKESKRGKIYSTTLERHKVSSNDKNLTKKTVKKPSLNRQSVKKETEPLVTSYQWLKTIRQRIKKQDSFPEYQKINAVGINLMAHQKAGSEIAEKFDRFAFFYDTGTGKTIMTLNIIAEKFNLFKAKFLIIAPKPLIKNAWLEDAEHFPKMRILPLSNNISFDEYRELYDRWAKEDGKALGWDAMYGGKKNMNLIIEKLRGMTHHFIINMERIVDKENYDKLISPLGVNGIIIDESALLKNYETKSSRRMRVASKGIEYLYLLSGQPAPNSPIEYYSQMKIVDPETFSMNFKSFKDEFFKNVSRFRLDFKNKASQQRLSDMVGNRSIIVKKDDCIDLPDQVSIKERVDLSEETQEFYVSVLNNFMAEIISMDGSVVTPTVRMSNRAKIAKLREISCGFYLDDNGGHHISSEKMETLNAVLDDIGNDQVIIWCNFQFEIEIIESELKKRGHTIVTAYGKTKNVDESIEKFKKGEAQYIIAHPKTLKYGVTFTNCHYAIYNSMSYSYEDYYQSHDRIYRNGQTQKCTYYHLLSKNTIDELIYKNIGDKKMAVKVFEQLIKTSSKFGFDKNKISAALKVSQKTVNKAISPINTDQ